MSAIEVRSLRKAYADGTEALRGVSFEVAHGEIFAYLGRNGAGKTTTVRVLSGLTNATAGTASVCGIEVVDDPGGVRSRVGVALQDAALDDLLTGFEHLELAGRLTGLGRVDARERARRLLQRFGLARSGTQPVAAYSG